MLEVAQIPKQQYFRIFGNKKYHIATKRENRFYCLCGNIYRAFDADASPISEYVGDECMSCRHATSKKIRRHGAVVLEIRIRRGKL